MRGDEDFRNADRQIGTAPDVQHHAELAGLVLVSGYYFWTVRPDVVPITVGALPGIGDVLRYTVSPLLGWLQMPLLKWQMFSPARLPARFKAEYSTGMIRSTFAAVPKRLAVLWAKAGVFGLVTLVLALPSTLIAFFAAQAILRGHSLNGHDIALSFSDPGVSRAVIGGATCPVAVLPTALAMSIGADAVTRPAPAV